MATIFSNSEIQALLKAYNLKRNEYASVGIHKEPYEIMQELQDNFPLLLKTEE